MSEWMVPYENLDEDQKSAIENANGQNLWIKGFPGSGKSVVLVHFLKNFLDEKPNAQVCIVVFTHSLIDMMKRALEEIGLAKVNVMTYFQFMKSNTNYNAVFCDEVQDLTEDVLRKMNSRAKQVYVAGDSNQSIYQDTVEPQDVGVHIKAEQKELIKIYRLPRTLVNASARVLPGADIFNAKIDNTKQDSLIRLKSAASYQEEVQYVWQEADRATAEGSSSAVLLPHRYAVEYFIHSLIENQGLEAVTIKNNRFGKPDYGQVNQYFKENNLRVEYVGNGYGSFQNALENNKLILMTYHSAKGIDFENVFLPFLSDDLFISREKKETIFMVAITRTRTNLYLTYSGILHPLVQRFKDCCYSIEDNQANTPSNTDLDFDF
jgi:superfamily I DNA/RNA helicase